jgi:hypothetical protein
MVVRVRTMLQNGLVESIVKGAGGVHDGKHPPTVRATRLKYQSPGPSVAR